MKTKKNNLEVTRAEKMGFCIGVKDAIDLAKELLENKTINGNIYMLGMLVHNSQVIQDLIENGVIFLEETDILENKIKLRLIDTVIIRAHGTLKKIYSLLEESGALILDAACIFVKRSRDLLMKKEKEGYRIFFIGDKDHPEVKGIISHGTNICVYKDLDELKNSDLDKKEKYYFLAQTTLNKNTYIQIKDYVKNKFDNSDVGNTICGATFERQQAVEKLANENEVVIVIGDKKSSNTKKLFQISNELNKKTFWIEKKEEIDFKWFEGIKKIGITAGASTPEKSIQEIENSIKGEQ